MVAGDTVNIMHTSPVSPRISCLRRIFPYSLQAGACSLPLGTPTHSNALFERTQRSSLPVIPLYLCEHILVSPRISCFRRIFPQFACRRSPARLPHASVGLVFQTIFLQTQCTFALFCVKYPENESVGVAFLQKCMHCTPICSLKMRAESCERFSASLSVFPRPFFLLSLVTFFPFSFVKEKEKESNEKS